MSIELSIDHPVKSPNVTTRMHWRERHRYNKGIKKAVWAAKIERNIYGQPLITPAAITIELRVGKEMDHDNAVGACKPIIDGLIAVGIIPDDSPSHVASLTVTQKKAPRSERGALIAIAGLSD